jgi:hypothetical protein
MAPAYMHEGWPVQYSCRIPSERWAQQAGYSQTNLVSNTAGVANTTDTQLLNLGGSRFFPGKIYGPPTTTAAPPRSMTRRATKILRW